jgi:Bacteriophage related domain of unknown function
MANRFQLELSLIAGRYQALVEPMLGFPVTYHNRAFTFPVDTPWARFSIARGAVENASLGVTIKRGVGIVYQQVFVPRNMGVLTATTAAEVFAQAFDNVTLWHDEGEIVFALVSMSEGIRDENYDMTNCYVSYRHDFIILQEPVAA